MTEPILPQPEDKVRMLKRIPLFAELSEDELQFIAAKMRLVEFKQDEDIYHEGDAADAFYVVASGKLKVYSARGGREQIFAYLHTGDSFGEISLLTGETHSASVRCHSDSLVLKLEKADFDEVINRTPSLVLYLSRTLSRRLRSREGMAGPHAEATIVAIYNIAEPPARARFAATLALCLQQETRRPAILLDLSHSGSDISTLLGLPEQRSLVHLETAGLGVDASVFESAMQTHPSGLRLLNVGRVLEGEMDDRFIAPLLSHLAERCSYIVLDLSAAVDHTCFKALTQADAIYLVGAASTDRLHRLHVFLKQMEELVPQAVQRSKIVCDRSDPSTSPADDNDCERVLGRAADHKLPAVIAEGSLSQWLERGEGAYVLGVRRIAREVAGLLVGLAFGSGAALGLAHIGVLKVLERERIPIDIISGSSMGALIAALWAAGVSAAEMETMATRFKRWRDCLWALGDFGFLALWRGFQSGDGVQRILRKDLGERTFKDTRIPLKIIAANPWTRESLIIEDGRLADAVRTSISIPGIFYPVPYRGFWSLDGGVTSPVPVRVLRRSGAKRIIAINVFPTTEEMTRYAEEVKRRRMAKEEMIAKRSFVRRVIHRLAVEIAQNFRPSVLDVIMRSMQMMECEIGEIECLEADLTLRPTLPGSHWIEFFSAPKFIARGEEVAEQCLPDIRKLLTEKT